MTTTDRIVQHTMSHELVVEKDKCVIQVMVYNNEDLKIVLENLTSKDIFQYDKDAIDIEIFTAKCKAAMSGLEFYNLMESVFESSANSNSYTCRPQNEDMILTFLVNIPMAHGKNLGRTFALTLIKQDQKEVDRVVKIVHDINRDKEAIMNTRALIDKLPEMIEAVRNDYRADLGESKTMLLDHKIKVDKLVLDVDALLKQNKESEDENSSDIDGINIRLNRIEDECANRLNLIKTEIMNAKTSINTVNDQLNNKITSLVEDIKATKTSLNTIGTKVDVANGEITKLQNNKPNIDFITLSAPLAFATDMTIGEYHKTYANSDLFIEAYLTVAGVTAIAVHPPGDHGGPSVSFVFGGCTAFVLGGSAYQSHYVNQLSTPPLTTLTFIVCITGNKLTGKQGLGLRFKEAPFTTLNPNETHCPGSGCGQTMSTFKITEIPK